MELNVDTSWYLRYRSTDNPDFGATFGQAVTIKGQPTIPLNDKDTPPDMAQPVPPKTAQESRMQAIANSAAFAFAMIEQGGSSLYSTLALQVTDSRSSGSCSASEEPRSITLGSGKTPLPMRWSRRSPGSRTRRRGRPSPISRRAPRDHAAEQHLPEAV